MIEKLHNKNHIIGFVLIHAIGITLTFLGYVDPLKTVLFHADLMEQYCLILQDW